MVLPAWVSAARLIRARDGN